MDKHSAATPAAPVPATTYESNPINLIKPAIAAFKLCWVNLLSLILSFIGVFVALLLAYAILNFLGAGPIGNVIVFLVGGPLALYGGIYLAWAITKCILAAVRGQKLTFKETLPTVWTDPLKLFWTQLLSGLLILVGLVFLIVPGIFAIAFWSYAPYVTVDTGVWGWAALKQSREIMRGRAWEVLGAIFLVSAVAIITIVPLLGPLVYTVFTFLTLPLVYLRYTTMLELKKLPDWEKTPVNKWNYIIFIIGLLAGGVQQYTSLDKLQKNSQPVEINHQAY